MQDLFHIIWRTDRWNICLHQEKFLIPAEIVANVQENNSLEHAFLVLSKVKYAKIPVLDQDQHFKGLLSLAMITETMLGLTGIDPTRLGRIQVKDVMQTDRYCIKSMPKLLICSLGIFRSFFFDRIFFF